MANESYGGVDYAEVAAGDKFRTESAAAGNVAATRAADVALTGAQTGAVSGFFAEEKARSQKQAAVVEARTQTSHMQRSMKMQNDQFDVTLSNERRLSKMDANATKMLVNKEKEIKYDSAGRKALSERQLTDWYTTRATTEEDWAGFQARSDQIYSRKIAVLQMSQTRIVAAMKERAALRGAEVNQELDQALAIANRDLKVKLAQEQTDAANATARNAGYAQVAGKLLEYGVGAGVKKMTGDGATETVEEEGAGSAGAGTYAVTAGTVFAAGSGIYDVYHAGQGNQSRSDLNRATVKNTGEDPLDWGLVPGYTKDKDITKITQTGKTIKRLFGS